MSDISLIVDTSSIGQARNDLMNLGRGVDEVSKSARSSASVFVNAFNKIERQLNTVNNYNRQYARSAQENINATLGVTQSSRSAAQAQKDFEAALRASDAEQKKATAQAKTQANELERLASKYKPLYAASKQYERAQEELNAAFQLGVIDIKQHEAALEQLNAEYAAFGNGSAGWSNQFVTGSTQAKRGMSSMGVVTQQLGYQVGDFAVQVQSGQSALVAFSQQATQLVGVLPLMANSLGMTQMAAIGLSAALGIGIPVVTALAGVLWTTTRNSGDAASGVETFEEKLKSARQEVSRSEEAIRLLNSGFENSAILTLDDAIKRAEENLKGAREELESFNNAVSVNAGASVFGGIFGGRAKAAQEAVKAAEEELRIARERFAEEERIRALEEGRKSALESFQELLRNRRQLQLEETRELQRQAAEMESNNALQAVANRYGQDSLQYLKARLLSERESLQNTLNLSNVSDTVKNRILAAADEAARLATESYNAENAIAGASSQAINLANNLMAAGRAIAGITGATMSLGIEAIGLRAQNEALQRGNDLIDARVAGLKATKRAELADGFNASDAAVRAAARQALDQYNQSLDEKVAVERENLALVDAFNESQKVSTGGSKKSAGAKKAETAAQKELNNLLKEAEAITSKNRTAVEVYADSIADLESHLNANRISTETYNRAAKELQDTLANSNPVVNSLADAFGDFVSGGLKDFKGFVDSIKSTFKNALAEMISTALKNRIVIPITTSGSPLGSLGGGLGGAFMSGLTGTASSFMTGGLSAGIGQIGANLSGATSSLAGLASAAGAVALPVAAAVAAISFFSSKTKVLDQGLQLTARNAEFTAESFKKLEKSRFFGLSKSTKNSVDAMSQEASAPLVRAYKSVYSNVASLGSIIGVSSKTIKSFGTQIKLSTKDMTEAEKQAALAKEFEKVSIQLARRTFWNLGTSFKALKVDGENAIQTLQRVSGSFSLVNDTLNALGFKSLSKTSSGLKQASRGVLNLGGEAGFQSSVDAYIQSTYSLTERTKLLANQLKDELRAIGSSTKRDTPEELRAAVDYYLKIGNVAKATRLIGLAPMVDSLVQLREESKAAKQAIRDEAAAKADAINETRLGLERRLLELQGNTAELRRRELEALDPTLRSLQMAIYKFEDLKEVLDNLDPTKFATKFEYELAKATGLIPMGGSGLASVATVGATAPIAVVQSDPATTNEIKVLRTVVEDLLIRIEENTEKSYRIERNWDRNGLPPERA